MNKSPWAGPTKKRQKHDPAAITLLIVQDAVEAFTRPVDGLKHQDSFPITMEALGALGGALLAYYSAGDEKFIDATLAILSRKIRKAAMKLKDDAP
jgi:hypothetical protein